MATTLIYHNQQTQHNANQSTRPNAKSAKRQRAAGKKEMAFGFDSISTRRVPRSEESGMLTPPGLGLPVGVGFGVPVSPKEAYAADARMASSSSFSSGSVNSSPLSSLSSSPTEPYLSPFLPSPSPFDSIPTNEDAERVLKEDPCIQSVIYMKDYKLETQNHPLALPLPLALQSIALPPFPSQKQPAIGHPPQKANDIGFLSSALLNQFLEKSVKISDREEEMSFECTFKEILMEMKAMFQYHEIELSAEFGMVLVGSGASSLLTSNVPMNDCDFVVHLKDNVNLCDVLVSFEGVICNLLGQKRGIEISCLECYRVFFRESFMLDTDTEKWSLVSFGSEGFSIDIKFIYKSKRTYAFSLDSFEIDMDQIISFKKKIPEFVKVRSAFGSYQTAINDLRAKKINTHNPGEIYHGLFRYCLEYAKGNRADIHVIYEIIFMEKFYEEFERREKGFFSVTLAKFLNKHKSHWFCILTKMHEMVYGSENERREEFLRDIENLMFFAK
eukprot:TRINITY_DN6961_c0_g1_i1.p1 TRINITY_DN6961_c0_g1~~TRINITY_DN6961_c0_g1_i1.p1  ORF type:complete len:501 (-),score=99.10 TRINITY_DN6961_c0_g1_i1:194-1696(-)